LVVTDPSETDGEVVYSEIVGSVHLEGHAGAQLVERLRWAARDAQVAEHRALLRAGGGGQPSRGGIGGRVALRSVREVGRRKTPARRKIPPLIFSRHIQ
jgi:hypothetical protein